MDSDAASRVIKGILDHRGSLRKRNVRVEPFANFNKVKLPGVRRKHSTKHGLINPSELAVRISCMAKFNFHAADSAPLYVKVKSVGLAIEKLAPGKVFNPGAWQVPLGSLEEFNLHLSLIAQTFGSSPLASILPDGKLRRRRAKMSTFYVLSEMEPASGHYFVAWPI